jgi:hypothetical protein
MHVEAASLAKTFRYNLRRSAALTISALVLDKAYPLPEVLFPIHLAQ